MFKNAIFKQKQEKEQLISLHYVERSKAAEAKKWLDSDLIKVVLGPRRAGKSVFSLMLLKDRTFSYFNFDDESIPLDGKMDYDELMKGLHAAYGKTKYILFDEIQNLPNWELFVNRLHREGHNLILTGSNAHLLSRELSTALTGRHIPIEILPFSFKEYLRAKQFEISFAKPVLPEAKGELLRWLEKYLSSGGYPEVVVKDLDARQYLKVLFDSLLFKDVVKRHKIRFSDQIENLGSYLLNNASCQYSLRKLVKILGFRSGITLEKYISYLIQAYMIFSLNRYSFKAGERIKSPRKAYAVDNGFITAKAVKHSPDQGRLFESLIFTELLKKGCQPNHDLFYYKTRNDREIDFLIKQGATITELVQSVYEISDPDIEKREVKALVEAGKELGVNNLTALTWDEKRETKEGGFTVNFIPVWERFLR